MTRVAVLGGGSWGTTFAAVLADAGAEVRLWARDPALCEQITTVHRNPQYLPGIELPPSIAASADATWVLSDAELVAIAIPAQIAAQVLQDLRSSLPASAIVVSLMKGVELGTDRRMSQVIAGAFQIDPARVAVLSGPNLAHEIAARQPTATVVAATSESTAQFVARTCANSYFRPYTNTDVIGVELCGAVKNVIALAVGIAHGQGFGQNTAATVLTRGLAEITRLGLALGARAETFAGLAGTGDLVATCSSDLSRNHSLGRRIGAGMSLEAALEATGGTAEGVKTSRSVLELARSVGVDMPITEAVVAVLFGGMPVAQMAPALLSRPHKAEGEHRSAAAGSPSRPRRSAH